jgi:hypothetical protein
VTHGVSCTSFYEANQAKVGGDFVDFPLEFSPARLERTINMKLELSKHLMEVRLIIGGYQWSFRDRWFVLTVTSR